MSFCRSILRRLPLTEAWQYTHIKKTANSSRQPLHNLTIVSLKQHLSRVFLSVHKLCPCRYITNQSSGTNEHYQSQINNELKVPHCISNERDLDRNTGDTRPSHRHLRKPQAKIAAFIPSSGLDQLSSCITWADRFSNSHVLSVFYTEPI